PLAILGFRQNHDRAYLCDGLGQNRRRQRRRTVGRLPQVALVERHVLHAHDPFVDLVFGDAIDQEKRVSVRKNPLDCCVVEGKRQVHGQCDYTSYHSRSSPPLHIMTVRTYTAEELATLFALDREVVSVLDLDELLRKIPELIGRLTTFQAFAVYLL